MRPAAASAKRQVCEGHAPGRCGDRGRDEALASLDAAERATLLRLPRRVAGDLGAGEP